MVPLMGSHIKIREFLSTSLTWTCQNILYNGLCEPKYDDFGWFGNLLCNATTSSIICNFTPSAFSYFLWRNLFTATPIPSWRPLPWPLLKKLQIILQPLIMLGYLDTKYQRLLLLNWNAQPSLHTQCHCGAYPCSTICCQCILKQCWTNLKTCFQSSKM